MNNKYEIKITNLLNKNNLIDYYTNDDIEFFNYYLKSKFNINKSNDNFINFSSNDLSLIFDEEYIKNNSYCYISKKIDNININFTNIEFLLNFIFNNKINIKNWYFIGNNLYVNNNLDKIFNLFLNYYKNLFKSFPQVFEFLKNEKETINITLFINNNIELNNTALNIIENYIDVFKSMNIQINFIYIDLNSNKIDENINNFLNKYNFKIYPYVTNNNINNMIEKYKDNIEKLNLTILDKGKWEKDKIKNYLNLLDLLINSQIKKENNIIELTKILFNKNRDNNLNLNKNIQLYPFSKNNSKYNCFLNKNISIKINNLSIVPCCGISEESYEAGYFNMNNFNIKNNVNAYYNIVESNPLFLPGCSKCEYRFFCDKGCISSQYKFNGDYLVPILSYCDLQKAKIDFLFNKYHELDLFHYYFQNYEIFNSKNSPESRRYLEFLLMKGYKEYEQYL